VIEYCLVIVSCILVIDTMRVYVKVIPKSSKNKIEKISDEEYKVWLTALPIEGKANKSLIEKLADYFNVSKSNVEIVGGKTSKIKIVDILGK